MSDPKQKNIFTDPNPAALKPGSRSSLDEAHQRFDASLENGAPDPGLTIARGFIVAKEFGVGIFSGEIDEPGQAPARKKIIESGATFLLPGRIVKSIVGIGEGPPLLDNPGARRVNKNDEPSQRRTLDTQPLPGAPSVRTVPTTSQNGPDGLPLRFALANAPAAIAGSVVRASGVEVFPGFTSVLTSDARGRVFLSGTIVALPPIITGGAAPPLEPDKFIGAAISEGVAPATGSLKPNEIEPVVGAAIRNLAGATGVRRELVHERADP